LCRFTIKLLGKPQYLTGLAQTSPGVMTRGFCFLGLTPSR
jgi:hypothetical protein